MNTFIIINLVLFILANSNHTNLQTVNSQKILTAYSEHIIDIKNNQVYWKDGSFTVFDDGKQKTFDEKLENADIEDQLSQVYQKGKLLVNPILNQDAGRIRNELFFKKIYGATKAEVEKNLVTIIWLPKSVNKKILVNKINGVDKKLQAISQELDKLPHLKKYLENPAGTFNWRNIAGTNRLSTHSFGITIDINVKYSNYWEWEKSNKPLVYKNQIPYEIVEIFEKHGFIWGGKWYHYDTMHFEYRPELL
jgi:hypothetical protein